MRQRHRGQVGATTARHHRSHGTGLFGCGHQRRRGAGAGTEQPQQQGSHVIAGSAPLHRLQQTACQKGDVECVRPVLGFALGQQIEQQRAELPAVQDLSDPPVARAAAAASAAVYKHDHAKGARRHHQVTGQAQRAERDFLIDHADLEDLDDWRLAAARSLRSASVIQLSPP